MTLFDYREIHYASYLNSAFLGQFVEVPQDCVFTVDYSVRTAQIAVFGLLDVKREVTPIYRGDHDIQVLLNAPSGAHAIKSMLGCTRLISN